MVTIQTKDSGEVRDVYRREVGYQWSLEKGCEDYIKFNMRIIE